MRLLNFSALCFLLMGPLTLAQQPVEIRWTGDRLSVRAADVLLAEVMAEVSRVTGIAIDGKEKLTGRLTIDFADLTPEDALATLLADANYIIKSAPAERAGRVAFTVMIHSSRGAHLPEDVISGPIMVRALDLLVAVDALDTAEMRKEEEDDDPDVIDDRFADTRQAAELAAQGAFGPEVESEALVKHLASVNDQIRLAALKAIGTRPMHGVALQAVVQALGDEVWEIRSAAVDILGRAKDLPSLRAVGDVLQKSHDRDVRIDALRVLARRAQPAAAPSLRAIAHDRDTVLADIAREIVAELDFREAARKATRR
jgi:uncharacterized protein (DUF2132 family)